MGFVACESSESQQDSARQGQGSGRPERSKHPTRYWLGNRQPDRWREQQEAGGGGHDDALDRLIRAHGKALPADLERFTLLAVLSGGSGSGGVTGKVCSILYTC